MNAADALLGIFGFRRVQHDWRPRAMGRYRCETCRAVGSLVDGVVVAYVCTVRGCGEAAVSCSRSSGQLCRRHQ